MAAVKAPPRLTKGSKARKVAKRHLPKLLRWHNRRLDEEAKRAKRPWPRRLLQRERRLAAKAAAKQALAEKRSKLAEFFGIQARGNGVEAA